MACGPQPLDDVASVHRQRPNDEHRNSDEQDRLQRIPAQSRERDQCHQHSDDHADRACPHRPGSFAGHYSGEIFLAFGTGTRLSRKTRGTVIETTRVTEEHLDGLFAAAVDATEESVLNSLCAADTVTGAGGVTVPGLPLELVVEILQAHGRSASLS